MPDQIIGRRAFVDRTQRDVYRDAHGDQYVQGNDGMPLYGWWIMPTEEEWENIPLLAFPRSRDPSAVERQI
jgi:hypothetical protein